jgi:enolase
MKIVDLHAREVLDSKGHPTVEAEVTLADGTKVLGQVPSGASTGATEAVELRDDDPQRYSGKGVLKAVANIKGPIKDLLLGRDAYDQENVDRLMIEADGTANKAKLGANAIVGVSIAVCRAAARSQQLPLYRYLGRLSGNKEFTLPRPQILLLEGGKHGGWATDVQEFFVIPRREAFPLFAERLRAGAEIFHALEKILADRGYATGVGYEGAFCPAQIESNEAAFQLMVEAVQKAGYRLPDQVVLGFDAAASEFFQDGRYVLRSEGGEKLSPREWSDKIIAWTKKYPIWSIEDGHDEEDWEEWVYLTSRVGETIQIVGDDLLTTNVERIQKAIDLRAVTSVLIKPNQIGSVSETIEAIRLADSAAFTTVVSQRGGETNDDFIADLVVGSTSWQSKFGGPDRGERLAKYNRLLRIEEKLTGLDR